MNTQWLTTILVFLCGCSGAEFTVDTAGGQSSVSLASGGQTASSTGGQPALLNSSAIPAAGATSQSGSEASGGRLEITTGGNGPNATGGAFATGGSPATGGAAAAPCAQIDLSNWCCGTASGPDLSSVCGTWFLHTALKREKNPANEVMRIARAWKRICQYFAREDTGEPYAGFVQARFMSNDLILGTITRRTIQQQPTLAPPTPKEPAAAPQSSPAAAAAEPGTSASKRPRAPAGTVTDIAQARTRKPKKG